MCGPFAAAAAAVSAALNVGSALASRSAQNTAQAAQDRAVKREHDRQAGFTAEADAHFKNSLKRAGLGEQERMMNEAVGKNTQTYSQAVAPGSEYLPGQGSAPAVIKGEMDRAGATADAANAQRASAQARLDAPADVTLGNRIDNSHKMDILGMLSKFRQGSMGVLPLELQDGAQKGGKLRMISDLMKAGGQVAGAASSAAPSSNWFSPAAGGAIGSNAAARGF